MGAGKSKRGRNDPHNIRLDLFLKDLESEKAHRKQIVEQVEELTFQTLFEKSKPKLRLNK